MAVRTGIPVSVLRIVAAAMFALAATRATGAATLVVTNLDPVSPGGLETLIATSAAGDSVTFATGLTGTIDRTSARVIIDHDLTITGPGSDQIKINTNGTAAPRGFEITAGRVRFSGLTIDGFKPEPPANYYFGQSAFSNTGDLTLENVNITYVWHVDDGAIRNEGTLTMSRCTVTTCRGSYGAAVYNGGTASIRDCEFVSNAAGHGIVYAAPGSHMELHGITIIWGQGANGGVVCDASAEVQMTNSTIYLTDGSFITNLGGSLAIRSCTMTQNTGVGVLSGGQTTIQNTIIANNYGTAFGGCCWTDLGFNLIETGVRIDPRLQAFGNYGGFTRTLPPAPGPTSPIIDQGNSAGLLVDQRSEPRPSDDLNTTNAAGGDGADIGAVELAAPPPPPCAKLLSPNASETWDVGTTHTISWTSLRSPVGITSAELWLTRDGGQTWENIARGLTEDGSYDWAVTGPGTLFNGSPIYHALVRVDLLAGTEVTCSDESDQMFMIYQSPLEVRDGRVATFALTRVLPNPSPGVFRAEFDVARTTAVKLSVIDLQGREAGVLFRGPLGPGRYSATWPRAGGGGSLAPGLYFLRYQAAGHDFVRRVAITP